MFFELTDQQQAVLSAVREFGTEEVRLTARQYNNEKRYPEQLRREATTLGPVAPHTTESTVVRG